MHTRKVILAARLKSIPYEVKPVVPVLPDSAPPNWRAISPTGLIPAIDDDGYVLADSTAILLYLERKRPIPALLPGDANSYGAALFLDAWAGSELFRRVVQPLFHNQIVAPNIRKTAGDRPAIDAALHEALPAAFGYLERRVLAQFLVGEALSIADVAVISNLITFQYLGHRIDAARYPKLAAYFGRHRASPALAALLDEERPFVNRIAGLERTF